MRKPLTDADIIALREKNLPRVTLGDLFVDAATIKMPDGTQRPLTEAELQEIGAYLRLFTRPYKSLDGGKTGTVQCPGCDSVLSRPGLMGLFSPGTFTWGLAHGQGFCSACGYPARAYHFTIGPIQRMEAILPVHPEELLTTEERAAAEDADRATEIDLSDVDQGESQDVTESVPMRERDEDDGETYADPRDERDERRGL